MGMPSHTECYLHIRLSENIVTKIIQNPSLTDVAKGVPVATRSLMYNDHQSSEEGTGWKRATITIEEQFINGYSYTIRDNIHMFDRA